MSKSEQALRLLEEGEQEVADLAGLERGSIHLVTSTLERMTGPMNEFLALHPAVSFHISQAPAEQMAHLLETGEADLIFSPLPVNQAGCSQAAVLSEDLYLAVPSGHHACIG